MTNGFAAHGPGMPPGRPKRWAATGGAPQLAVHGAWRFEWADQMMEVVLRAISDRHFRKNDRKPGIKWLSCMVEVVQPLGRAVLRAPLGTFCTENESLLKYTKGRMIDSTAHG
jgi:hypothetical protein